MTLRTKPVNEHTRYFVVDHNERQSYSLNWQSLATISAQLERARANLSQIMEDDVTEVPHPCFAGQIGEAVNPRRVEELADLFQAINHLDRAIPNIGPVWCVGYGYARSEGFSVWSGHVNRDTAERFRKAWARQESGKGLRRRSSNWEVRKGSCSLTEFVPEGVSPADVTRGCFL